MLMISRDMGYLIQMIYNFRDLRADAVVVETELLSYTRRASAEFTALIIRGCLIW